ECEVQNIPGVDTELGRDDGDELRGARSAGEEGEVAGRLDRQHLCRERVLDWLMADLDVRWTDAKHYLLSLGDLARQRCRQRAAPAVSRGCQLTVRLLDRSRHE